MRCTRCDGLVIPQAVGVHPDGRVVFGWCLRCLFLSHCSLVEIPEDGPEGLKLVFKPGEAAHWPGTKGNPPRPGVDQTQWIIALITFLMISWGLILLAAGLFSGPRPPLGAGSPGHDPSPLLAVGGSVTAFLGLGLLVLAARRDWLPGAFVLVMVSWLSLATGLGIMAYALTDDQRAGNVPIFLGVALAVLIATIARILERSVRRKSRTITHYPLPKPAAASAWEQVWGLDRLN